MFFFKTFFLIWSNIIYKQLENGWGNVWMNEWVFNDSVSCTEIIWVEASVGVEAIEIKSSLFKAVVGSSWI